ncbi:MAG: carbamoyltransferase [Myxococcota bacterium]
MDVLGISCFYHDAAASIVRDGEIVAAAQEERFTRVKHDDSFPVHSILYCLAEAGISGSDLDAVAFYDKPILKFHRILETYFSVAPAGLRPYMKAVPLWLTEKLWIEPRIQDGLKHCGVDAPDDLYFPSHHESHAAAAFYPSPFRDAAVLTVDGVGEWATATLSVGEGNRLKILGQIDFPHSLGLLYSAFTYFTGFEVNSGEYKLMGLAPYGEGRYTDLIKSKLIDIKDDGSFRLDMDYFGYLDDLVMTNQKFDELFGGPARDPEAPITRRELDIARSVQEVTEEITMKLARCAKQRTGKSHLCLSGGVALNCVANGKILREGLFDDIWIQPAAGDAGSAVGAALQVWYGEFDNARDPDPSRDSMQGGYLGPEFSREQIQGFLGANGCVYRELLEGDWARSIAELIAEEKVVGLFQGRMEFGPCALGNRSIIADARSEKMQSILNQKIKFRESFRPFAPSCLEERVSDYFQIDRKSPYMLLVAPVNDDLRVAPKGDEQGLEIHEWVNRARSSLPAVTHVDYSARIQTVSRSTNERYYAIIEAFEEQTGCGVIINTSFNVRDEPIVCTPDDAYNCFMRTEMDCLVLGDFLLEKGDQLDTQKTDGWGGGANS